MTTGKKQLFPDSNIDSGRYLYLRWFTIAAIVIFYSVTIREGHNWNGDFAQLIHHAKNISEGKNYQEIHYIINPYNWLSPITYPPVLPVLLAPVYFFFGINLTAMKLLMIACFATSIIVINKVYKKDLAQISLLILTVAVGFNPHYWDFKDRILSEFPFLLFSFLSLLLMQRCYMSQRPGDNRLLPVLLGITMYLTYGTREIGIVLPLTVLAFEVINYRRLTRTFLISFVIFSSFVAIQNYVLKNDYFSSELQQQLSRLEIGKSNGVQSHFGLININIDHISHQIHGYLYHTRAFFSWSSKHLLGSVMFYFIGLSSVVGFFITLMKRCSVLEIYPVGYIAVLLLFSGEPRMRYLIPIIPFLFYYVLIGIESFNAFGARRNSSIILSFILVLIIGLYAYNFVSVDYGPIKQGPSTRESTEMFSFISNTTKADDLIIFVRPRVLSLFTQRDASSIPRRDDPEFLIRYLDTIGADYVISGEIDGEKDFMKLLIDQRSHLFNKVFQNKIYTIYRYKNLSKL